MSNYNLVWNKKGLASGFVMVFALGLSACSDEKPQPLSSNSSEGISFPAASQPSAADVKQPVPMAAPTAQPLEKTTPATVTPKKVKSGASAYASCVGCHGAVGEGGVGPRLAGQTKTEIVAKLNRYKVGEQVGPMTAMMAPMAQNLSADEVQLVSEYIATF